MRGRRSDFVLMLTTSYPHHYQALPMSAAKLDEPGSANPYLFSHYSCWWEALVAGLLPGLRQQEPFRKCDTRSILGMVPGSRDKVDSHTNRWLRLAEDVCKFELTPTLLSGKS